MSTVANYGANQNQRDYNLAAGTPQRDRPNLDAVATDTDRLQDARQGRNVVAQQQKQQHQFRVNNQRQRLLGSYGIGASLFANAWANTDKTKPASHRLGQVFANHVPGLGYLTRQIARANSVREQAGRGLTLLKTLNDPRTTDEEHGEVMSKLFDNTAPGVKNLVRRIPLVGSASRAAPRSSSLPFNAPKSERIAAGKQDLADYAKQVGGKVQDLVQDSVPSGPLRALAGNHQLLTKVLQSPKEAATHLANAVIDRYIGPENVKKLQDIPQRAAQLKSTLTGPKQGQGLQLLQDHGLIEPQHAATLKTAASIYQRLPDKADLNESLNEHLAQKFPRGIYNDDDLDKAKATVQQQQDKYYQEIKQQHFDGIQKLARQYGIHPSKLGLALHREGILSDDTANNIASYSASDPASQALAEQVRSKGKTPVSKEFAAKSIDLIRDKLPESVRPYVEAASGNLEPVIKKHGTALLNKAVEESNAPEFVKTMHKDLQAAQAKGASPADLAFIAKNHLQDQVTKKLSSLSPTESALVRAASNPERASNIISQHLKSAEYQNELLNSSIGPEERDLLTQYQRGDSEGLRSAALAYAAKKGLPDFNDPTLNTIRDKLSNPDALRDYASDRAQVLTQNVLPRVLNKLEDNPNGFLHRNQETIRTLIHPASSSEERRDAALHLATDSLPEPYNGVTKAVLHEVNRIKDARARGEKIPIPGVDALKEHLAVTNEFSPAQNFAAGLTGRPATHPFDPLKPTSRSSPSATGGGFSLTRSLNNWGRWLKSKVTGATPPPANGDGQPIPPAVQEELDAEEQDQKDHGSPFNVDNRDISGPNVPSPDVTSTLPTGPPLRPSPVDDPNLSESLALHQLRDPSLPPPEGGDYGVDGTGKVTYKTPNGVDVPEKDWSVQTRLKAAGVHPVLADHFERYAKANGLHPQIQERTQVEQAKRELASQGQYLRSFAPDKSGKTMPEFFGKKASDATEQARQVIPNLSSQDDHVGLFKTGGLGGAKVKPKDDTQHLVEDDEYDGIAHHLRNLSSPVELPSSPPPIDGKRNSYTGTHFPIVQGVSSDAITTPRVVQSNIQRRPSSADPTGFFPSREQLAKSPIYRTRSQEGSEPITEAIKRTRVERTGLTADQLDVQRRLRDSLNPASPPPTFVTPGQSAEHPRTVFDKVLNKEVRSTLYPSETPDISGPRSPIPEPGPDALETIPETTQPKSKKGPPVAPRTKRTSVVEPDIAASQGVSSTTTGSPSSTNAPPKDAATPTTPPKAATPPTPASAPTSSSVPPPKSTPPPSTKPSYAPPQPPKDTAPAAAPKDIPSSFTRGDIPDIPATDGNDVYKIPPFSAGTSSRNDESDATAAPATTTATEGGAYTPPTGDTSATGGTHAGVSNINPSNVLPNDKNQGTIPLPHASSTQKGISAAGDVAGIGVGAAELADNPVQGVSNIATGGLALAGLLTQNDPTYTPPPVLPQLGTPNPVTFNSANTSANAVINNAASSV